MARFRLGQEALRHWGLWLLSVRGAHALDVLLLRPMALLAPSAEAERSLRKRCSLRVEGRQAKLDTAGRISPMICENRDNLGEEGAGGSASLTRRLAA